MQSPIFEGIEGKINDKTNSFYHSIISMDMYGAKIPVSCGVDLFAANRYFDTSLLVFGMIPNRTFPVIEYNQAVEKIKGEFIEFQPNEKFKQIDTENPTTTMEQAVINALSHLYDTQLRSYTYLLSSCKKIREKHMYFFHYVDDNSLVQDFTIEEDMLPYITIYLTINKKHAKSALKQFRKAFGRNKVIMCKTKISKYLDIAEKNQRDQKEKNSDE